MIYNIKENVRPILKVLKVGGRKKLHKKFQQVYLVGVGGLLDVLLLEALGG